MVSSAYLSKNQDDNECEVEEEMLCYKKNAGRDAVRSALKKKKEARGTQKNQ